MSHGRAEKLTFFQGFQDDGNKTIGDETWMHHSNPPTKQAVMHFWLLNRPLGNHRFHINVEVEMAIR
jgi:hypothetical protein